MSDILYIFVLIGALVIAPVVHLIIAYGIAPKKAKESILNALVNDDNFQTLLMQSIVINFNKKMKFKDNNGVDFEIEPINLFSDIFIKKFNQQLNNEKESMVKQLTSNAETHMAAMPQNPLLSLALSQLPKKYLPYVQIIANLMLQNQPQE